MKAGQLEKGMYILFKNEPYLVVDREFVNPGKGSAFVRCKIKGVKNGQILKETIKSQDSVDPADVEQKKGQYLYVDGSAYFFMDEESYEQYQLIYTGYEYIKDFAKEGESYQLVFFNGDLIDVILPLKVKLVVSSAQEAIKGDTATSVTKMVECETGLQVKVPGFIKEGDTIVVNTSTREYVERTHA